MSTEHDVEAVLDCLRSGWLTMGPRIKAFEEALAEWVGTAHAITVSNGDAALFLALRAVGVEATDHVYACTEAAERAARRAGAVPMGDPTDRTRACVVALGSPSSRTTGDGVPIIEDATEWEDTAPRLTGTAAAFSFAEGRPLAIGEGGMVITDDDQVAARVRALRAHAMTSGTWDRHRGHSDSYDIVDVGFNFRMDEPRAALGLARLEQLR
jgi:dTDP-4-amino-4,6-dideoxygalactose transaminase